ncbi:MAG: universal stress protein [Trinickia sp.]|jgi:nucleotide-binding universal stress UspA family protein
MYKRILVPIDGSPTSQRAFDYALAMARESQAELIPVYVIDIPMIAYEAPGFDPSIVRDALLETGERLKTEANAAMERDDVKGISRVLEVDIPGSSIPERILQEARATHCDLVVMGTHGRRGVQRLMLGSVAERFTRMSCCPVLLVPGSIESAGATQGAAENRTHQVLL